MKIKTILNVASVATLMTLAPLSIAASVSGKVSACSVKADGTQIYFLTEDTVCGSSNVIYASSNLDLSPSVADQFFAACLTAKVTGQTLAVYNGDCNSSGKMYLNSSGEVRIR